MEILGILLVIIFISISMTIMIVILNVCAAYKYSDHVVKNIEKNGHYELINGHEITFYQEKSE